MKRKSKKMLVKEYPFVLSFDEEVVFLPVRPITEEKTMTQIETEREGDSIRESFLCLCRSM